MKQVLILAAPFGFGPASKAIRLAQILSPAAQVTLVSAGDAHHFVADHAPAGTVCREGALSALYKAQDMRGFDLIVCVDNAPAARRLSRSEHASRVVFVDDLLQWRIGQDELGNKDPILAYLVQDFPGAAQHLPRCHARHVELVAPMVWGDAQAPVPASERSGLTLCIGGGTSPLVSWDHIRHPVARVLTAVWQVCRQLRMPLSVIGSASLSEFATRAPAQLKVLGSVSPARSSELIGASRLLITTPGIGATYEAIRASTPVLLLPPMNSTQLQQFQVFRQHGIAHALAGSPLLDELRGVEQMHWNRHARGCIDWTGRNLDAVAHDVAVQAAALCESPNAEATSRLLLRQDAVVQALSSLDIRQPLLQLLNGSRSDQRN